MNQLFVQLNKSQHKFLKLKYLKYLLIVNTDEIYYWLDSIEIANASRTIFFVWIRYRFFKERVDNYF